MEKIIKTNKVSESKRRSIAALASGGIAAPALLASNLANAATAPVFEARMAPKLYPKNDHVSEIDLTGKVAVITGASRGIGLAVGQALKALGVQVIGTSRTPTDYPGHPFPLLTLDLADPASIQSFAAAVSTRPEVQTQGGIDILVNNAGRTVLGGIIPVDPTMYFSGIQTGLATLYGGHIAVTSALLQLVAARAASGYARILFTTSVQSYSNGGVEPALSYIHNYNSSKRALLAYANSLRTILNVSGVGIKVSTLNPLWVNTDLMKGNRAIYLQPADANGNAINDPIFQSVIDLGRQYLANGLPASFAAKAWEQLLTSENPEANVVVGSDEEPYASQGQTKETLALFMQETKESAFPWKAGPVQAQP